MSMENISNLAIVAMVLVGLGIFAFAWGISDAATGYIKADDNGSTVDNQKSFDNSVRILSAMGLILAVFSATMGVYRCKSGSGAQLAGVAPYELYMGMCGVLSLIVIIFGSMATDKVDGNKEIADADGNMVKTTAKASLGWLIGLAVVALLVSIAFVGFILRGGKSEDFGSSRMFGFDFEF
jgi:hypothetical protein